MFQSYFAVLIDMHVHVLEEFDNNIVRENLLYIL